MVKNKDREDSRQRNARRRKKREHDEHKGFYNYIFIQDPELVLFFEGKHSGERQKEEMACINDFDLSLPY